MRTANAALDKATRAFDKANDEWLAAISAVANAELTRSTGPLVAVESSLRTGGKIDRLRDEARRLRDGRDELGDRMVEARVALWRVTNAARYRLVTAPAS